MIELSFDAVCFSFYHVWSSQETLSKRSFNVGLMSNGLFLLAKFITQRRKIESRSLCFQVLPYCFENLLR